MDGSTDKQTDRQTDAGEAISLCQFCHSLCLLFTETTIPGLKINVEVTKYSVKARTLETRGNSRCHSLK